jgi:hypothetical protein
MTFQEDDIFWVERMKESLTCKICGKLVTCEDADGHEHNIFLNGD